MELVQFPSTIIPMQSVATWTQMPTEWMQGHTHARKTQAYQTPRALQTCVIVNHTLIFRAYNDDIRISTFRDVQRRRFQGPNVSELVIMTNSWACCAIAAYGGLINTHVWLYKDCMFRHASAISVESEDVLLEGHGQFTGQRCCPMV